LESLEPPIQFLGSNKVSNPSEDLVPPKLKNRVDIGAKDEVRLVAWEIFPEWLVYSAQS
jgi:hypothetical protein